MNAVEKEWGHLDTQIAKYGQNSHQTFLLKMPSGHVQPWTGYVRSRWMSCKIVGYVRSTQKLSSQL
jgi:hypothetical protein